MTPGVSWERYSDPHAAQRDLVDLRREALWLHCAAVVTTEVNGSMRHVPFVHIDPGERADVADVPGAVGREGMTGWADIAWRFILFSHEAEGVMVVETTVPIRCQFQVAISARVHREVLEQIASAQRVALATICPQAVVGVPPAIWIAVSETDALRMALARCPS